MVLLSGAGVDDRAAEAMSSMDEEVLSGEGIAIDETAGVGTGKGVQRDAEMETWETGKYLLGKSYFDCKEYDRAAFALKGCQSCKSQFLRLHSKFLVYSHSPNFNRRSERKGKRMIVRRFWVHPSGH